MDQPSRKTSESAEKLRSFVGQSSGTHAFSVTEAALQEFCAAVGARYRGGAPATFMTVFRHGEFELLDRMEFPLKSALHADQEFRYDAPIRAGDEVEYRATLTKAFEKNGATGPMKFLVFETVIHARRGAENILVGSSKTTIIIR